jgi:hypothetical protein
MLTIWPTSLKVLVALVPSIAHSLPRTNRRQATIDVAVGSELIAVSGCVSA